MKSLLLTICLLLTYCLHSSPKLLVLIIASDDKPIYIEDQKVWRSYMHSDPEHVEAYFIKCNPLLTQDVLIEEDTIWVKEKEALTPGILNKTLVAMETLLPRIQTEFDFVLRTNLSSFFIFPRLLTFLNHCPASQFYGSGGGTGQYGYTTREWGHGCGYLLSKDLVELLVGHKEELYNRVDDNDDVVVGKFLINKHHVPLSDTKRLDLLNYTDWERHSPHIPSDVFHFRVNNCTHPERRLIDDLFIYSELLHRFYPKPKETLHLVWIDYPPERIWCAEWLLDLFDDFNVSHVLDLEHSHFEDKALIVISKPGSVENQLYLNQYHQKHLRYGLIHLGDETYEHPTDIYTGADMVFREYWHKKFADQKNVLCIPAGHQTSVFKDCQGGNKSIFSRQFVWSFAGEWRKSTRPQMLASMTSIRPYTLKQGLSHEAYRDLLLDTIFVPCPRDWWNLDSLRVLESLEAGCIPIVEKSPIDYFRGLFGSYPFLAVNSWDEAPALITALVAQPQQLEQLRRQCHQWWIQYKSHLKTQAEQHIHSKWPPATPQQ